MNIELIKTKKILIWVAVISGSIFLGITVLVKIGIFNHIDFSITNFLQQTIRHKLAIPLSLFSIIGSVEVTSVILLAILRVNYRRRLLPMMVVILLFLFPQTLELLCKKVLYHPGPPKQFFHYNFPLLSPSHYVHSDYTYPSGHMLRITFLAIFGIIMLAASKQTKRRQIWGIVLWLMVFFLTAISRVYLGEHWTSDVLGGIFLGLTFGSLAGIYYKDCYLIDDYAIC